MISTFVPLAKKLSQDSLKALKDFITSSKRLFVLTGAGVSTESGIRDYRSEGVGLYATNNQKPVQYNDFLKNERVRQRYWARNTVAWNIFSKFQPNSTHTYLAKLEHQGHLHWLVTQNVDGLHLKAGSRRLTELHGTMSAVICLQCQAVVSRELLQRKISLLNPNWQPVMGELTPDSDVVLNDEDVHSFTMPLCDECGGVLKPHVTFFGESVSKIKVYDTNQRISESDALLIAGSSCETYSAYRHILHAHSMTIPICILNIGKTRADHLADLKVEGRCGEAFEELSKQKTL